METIGLRDLPPDGSSSNIDSMMIKAPPVRYFSTRVYMDGEFLDPSPGALPPVLLSTTHSRGNVDGSNVRTNSAACNIL